MSSKISELYFEILCEPQLDWTEPNPVLLNVTATTCSRNIFHVSDVCGGLHWCGPNVIYSTKPNVNWPALLLILDCCLYEAPCDLIAARKVRQNRLNLPAGDQKYCVMSVPIKTKSKWRWELCWRIFLEGWRDSGGKKDKREERMKRKDTEGRERKESGNMCCCQSVNPLDFFCLPFPRSQC